MSVSVLSPASARRRFVALSALRWLPICVVIPVMVLLMTSRGYGLATVAVVYASHGVVVALLELPTGGLADVLGRRKVLLLSAALFVAAVLAFAVARELWQFYGAIMLLGTGRALSSGPLEAWYVDTVHATDPEADLKPGLSRAYAAEAVALAVGAVGGGFLPTLFDRLPDDGALTSLSVPPLVAAALGLAYLTALALLVREPPPDAPRPGWRSTVRGVPATVRDGVRLAARDRVVLRLLAMSAAIGLVMYVVEMLTPVQLAQLLGSRSDASATYGLLVTAGFLASAGGSSLAPAAVRLLGSSARTALVAGMFTAVPLLVLAGGEPVGLFVVGYVGLYLLVAVAGPLRNELLHHRVSAAHRSTILSVQSLVLQGAGVVGGVALPRLAEAAGFAWAWIVAAVVVLLGSLFLLRLPVNVPAASPRRDQEPLLDQRPDGLHPS